MNVISLYLSKGQSYYDKIVMFGERLKKAMGEKEILSRSLFRGGEFRPPTYRAYAEALDCMWTAYNIDQRMLNIVPYSTVFDGWKSEYSKGNHRGGFMSSAINSYEYSYDVWNEWTKDYYPDLFDDGTFAVWQNLLPGPSVILIKDNKVKIRWNPIESRVHRSKEMGRYCLSKHKCFVEASGSNWREARAEAYVLAWEKMAANEPLDRYEAVIIAEQKVLDERWKR